MNRALLDTDIFSEITKGVDQAVAANARTYRKAFRRYTISAVTFMEVVRGYRKKQASRHLHAFLAAISSEKSSPSTTPPPN